MQKIVCNEIVELIRFALLTKVLDEINEVLSLKQGKLVLNHTNLFIAALEEGSPAHLLKM